MESYFWKIIYLAVIYGIAVLLSDKGAQGNLVRIGCTLGMIMLIFGAKPQLEGYRAILENEAQTIIESKEKGQDIYFKNLEEHISESVREDVAEMAEKYGSEIEINVYMERGETSVEVKKIQISGVFKSSGGLGFLKHDMKERYENIEVDIIEK